MKRRDLKPYQARPLLKSIRYWQSIVNGTVEPKRPRAYYVNQLKFFSDDDIKYIEGVADKRMVKEGNSWKII